MKRACLATLALSLSGLAWAEERGTAEVAAAYSLLSDGRSQMYGLGWMVSGTWSFGGPAQLVVQGAGNYRSDDSGSRLGGFIHYRHHAVLGGGRLSTRQQRGKCFAQMLVGVSVKTESPDRVSGFGYFNSVDPAIQPGVGMCVFLSRRFGLELGVDYRWVGGDSSDDSNLVLLHLGVTFGFRRRV